MSAASRAQVVTLGETMAMLHTPEVGSLAHLGALRIDMGGAESNVAIGLQRLGTSVAWISRLGEDELGERVAREMRAEGVAVHAPRDPERPTGLMIKSHPRAGATRVRYYRSGSAASALSPQDLPDGLIEQAELLHLTGITPLLSDAARAATTAALERARTAGVTVSVDVNHRSALASREVAAALISEVALRADVVFGGPEELALVLGESAGAEEGREEELMRAVQDRGVGEVVCKRGADGASSLLGDEIRHVEGMSVPVVDTVGAGDAFVAGYLSARGEGLDPQQRLERANACGAFACTAAGDWEAAPRLADLDTLGRGGDPVAR